MNEHLTAEETEILRQVMDIIEQQFDNETEVDYHMHDSNIVYLDVLFKDGTSQYLKLRRELLDRSKTDKTLEEIASLAW